jgi:hypothetical protein
VSTDLARVYGFFTGWLSWLLADMSDDELRRPIAPGQHAGLWVLGHLNFAGTNALKILGEDVSAEQRRLAAFAPGSKPGAEIPPEFTKASLLADLRANESRIASVLARTDPAVLAAPHGRDYFSDTPLKTLGDVLTQLLTVHAGYHLGQLSVYRASLGKPALF